MSTIEFGMGWLRDYPDFRDYTTKQDDVALKHQALGQKDSIQTMLTKMGVEQPSKVTIPASVDWRRLCSPIENQRNLGSCTAQAGVGLVEYFERRAFGRHTNASRLFLYKVTRDLLRWTGDTGAYLRTTMAALALFGTPPEKYWPYVIADYDIEPSAFCYSLAQNYQAIQYYRLDPPRTSKRKLLRRIKLNLAAGLPSMFGFTVYRSISQARKTGKIPFPVRKDTRAGGHAIVAVGYDDGIEIKNNLSGSKTTTGALLIRNSWGTNWGDNGYGWLPYDYVLRGLAVDWWSLLRNEWVDTGQFGI